MLVCGPALQARLLVLPTLRAEVTRLVGPLGPTRDPRGHRRVPPRAISAEPAALQRGRPTSPPVTARGGTADAAPAAAGKSESRTKAAGRSSPASAALSEIKRLGGRFLAEGSSPSWSPTGSSIVYCHGDELMVLDIQNGKTRRLVAAGRSPAWSPGDGRYIAYVNGRVGEEEIFLCEAAGGSPQRLAAGKNPHWSKDGRMLYFCSTQKPQWYTIGVDRKLPAVAVDRPRDLPSAGEIGAEAASRAGQQIKGRLRIVNRKTGKSVREWPLVKVDDETPVLSPAGRYLALAGFRCASGVILGVLDVKQNLLLRVGGSQFGCPRWSPDGSQLAVVVRRPDHSEIWSLEISALQRSQPLAPACVCPDVPQAAAELIGPWHRPRGKLSAIDLSRHYTAAKSGIKSNVDNDNPLELAAGTRLLAGVEFQIGDRMIQLRGQRVPQMPPAVNGIPVHHRVVRLYILHAAQDARNSHGVREGELIAEYRVRYADGDLATIPVNVGQDVRDWWTEKQEPLTRAQVVWAGKNKAASDGHCYLQLYLLTWENPYPEKTVVSIDYVSMGHTSAPFCVAMTAEEPQSVGQQGPVHSRPRDQDQPDAH